MKIKPLLEALSSEIYHFTSFKNAISILYQNKFSLATAMAKNAEVSYVKADRYFYLSTTRTKLGRYGVSSYVMIAFVLDGNLLNQKYHGEALDYYGDKTEHEDRLTTKEPYIYDANKYIKRIDVYLNDESIEKYSINYLNELVQAANNDNVKILFYKTREEFNLSKHGIKGDDFLKMYEKEGPLEKTYPHRNFEDESIPYINAIKGVNLDDEKTKKLIYTIKYYPQDLRGKLGADFHNNYNTNVARELTKLALKFKLKNINDIVNYLIDKYK